ncbi:ABC transporter permease subunit [Corynebacterium striatum]
MAAYPACFVGGAANWLGGAPLPANSRDRRGREQRALHHSFVGAVYLAAFGYWNFGVVVTQRDHRDDTVRAGLASGSTADSFDTVPAAVASAATAMGYSPLQRVFQVELPLAGPGIIAGLRVVSASTISLISVGALVGVHSLGTLFTEGFQRNFPTQIIAGFVGTVLLAVLFDLLLVLIGRVLLPWARKAS